MKIDAHQHFWKLDRGDYGWLTPDLDLLYRDFLPDDLKPILDGSGIDGTVLVQAADSDAETDFMLDLAATHDWILGVVGWVSLSSDTAIDRLTILSRNRKFCGVRPMLQDIAQTDWVLDPANHAALTCLSNNDVAFDALIQPRHFAVIDTLAARYPELKIVIDHGAKPDIANHMWDDWKAGLDQLALHENCFCKLSGLATETSPQQTLTDTARYGMHVLETFGPHRTIWGSDWPVCTLRTSIDEWKKLCERLVGPLSIAERDAVFGDTATMVYGVGRALSD